MPSILRSRRILSPDRDPHFASVSLLLDFDDTNGSTNFFDRSLSRHAITANGNAKISTTQSVFGGSSLALDGNGDFLGIDGSQFNLPGDFTVEAWFSTQTNALQVIAAKWNFSGSLAWALTINNGAVGNVTFALANSGFFQGSFSGSPGVALNTWHHVAVTRSGSLARIFLNGIQTGNTTTVTANLSANTGNFNVGQHENNFYFNGYIDDIRITKGVARYVTNFSPPQRSFPRG